MDRIVVSTDRQIAALKARPTPYWATVEGCAGLRIKVTEGRRGTNRVFYYRYKAPDGRAPLKKIDDYRPPRFGLKEAVEAWRDLRKIRETHGYVKERLEQERQANVDALSASKTQAEHDAYTVNTLAKEFVEHQSQRIKTWSETDRILKVYVLPKLGTEPAHAVRRAAVVEILDNLTADGKDVQANRVLAAVRKAFNWALEREKGGIEVNPCTGIRSRQEAPRERVLDDAELRRLLVNLPGSELAADDQDLLRFILFTGCRLSEACGAATAEFHDDVWVLPAGRAKNAREHRLPLSKQAAELVKRRAKGRDFLFTLTSDPDRPMRKDHIHGPLRVAIPALKVLPFTCHDLRRSTASGIAALGAPRDIVRRVLNHVDPSVTGIYDKHDYLPEMRKWLQSWAAHLDKLQRSNVRRLRRRSS